MSKWELESNYTNQIILSILGLFFGIIFILLSKNSGIASDPTQSISALILGILIFFVSLFSLIFGQKRFITLDEKSKTILFRNKNKFREKKVYLHFNEILELNIIELGDKDGGSIYYDLEIKLKKGNNINLFAGSFFDQRSDKSEMESLRKKLAEYIGLKI